MIPKKDDTKTDAGPSDKKDTSIDHDKPTIICSLKRLRVSIPDDIRDHLARQYQETEDAAAVFPESYERIDRILLAMKTPPATTTCRVNLIQGPRQSIRKEVETEIQQRELDAFFEVRSHPNFPDILYVDQKQNGNHSNTTENHATDRLDRTGPATPSNATSLFPSWSSRGEIGWPVAHRVVIVDRFCGEAVLRGAHIFVRGILVADRGIQPEETVAVYADIRPNGVSGKSQTINRGLSLEQYKGRTCLYLGLGVTQCSRSDFFRLTKGVGIQMKLESEARVGPVLPPISGMLPSKIYFQNLPSMVVAHALSPQPGDTIIDMCAAPGGKTSHVASLVNNEATIVACDVSRRKMLSVQAMFQEMGATCITPIALNTTDCVIKDEKKNEDGSLKWHTVQEVSGIGNIGS